VPPRVWPDAASMVTTGVGFALFFLGIVRVVRTGPETYVTRLRHISNTVVARLGEPTQLTEPLVTAAERFPRRRPTSLELLRSGAKVTFVVGEAEDLPAPGRSCVRPHTSKNGETFRRSRYSRLRSRQDPFTT
jgi:hypothetical protein